MHRVFITARGIFFDVLINKKIVITLRIDTIRESKRLGRFKRTLLRIADQKNESQSDRVQSKMCRSVPLRNLHKNE